MKIAIISSSYHPKVGGLERFVDELAQAFLEVGNKPILVTQKYLRISVAKSCSQGLPVKRYLFFDPKPPYRTARSIAAYGVTLISGPLNLMLFILGLRGFNPAIINYQFVGAPTFFLLLYLMFFPTKLVVSLHGEDVRQLPFESKLSMLLFKKILKKADFITANSFYLLKRALSVAPFIENKSKVIHSGIDLGYFATAKPYQHRRKYILSIGRLVEKKGFDVLLEAFFLAATDLKDTDLIIAGEGPKRSLLEQIIKERDLGQRVFLYGRAAKNQIAELLRGCECFVLPSRDEPFGIVILEAAACGKPVIASRSGGPEEVIEDGVSGLLVKKDDSRQLSEAIKRLLGDSGLQEKLSTNASENAKKFDMAAIAAQYLEIFQKAQ
jgi:glycosyltransferase involved in cell wall biosynthesis